MPSKKQSPRLPDGVELHRYDYSRAAVLPAGPVRLVLADPPYNWGVKYAADRSRDSLPEHKYREMCASALRHHARWLEPGGTVWWVVPPTHVEWLGPLMSAIVGPRLHFIAWHETFSQYNQHDLTRDWRAILVHTNDRKLVQKRMDRIRVPSARLEMKTPDKRADKRGRIPGSVWRFRRLQGTSTARVSWHGAQLPPELMQRILLGWSDEGDRVLDGFAGSGSMGVEAMKLGRHFVGVERAAEYIRKMGTRFRAVQRELDDVG